MTAEEKIVKRVEMLEAESKRLNDVIVTLKTMFLCPKHDMAGEFVDCTCSDMQKDLTARDAVIKALVEVVEIILALEGLINPDFRNKATAALALAKKLEEG